MKNKKQIIIIAGPTASGKTNLGIELAKKINGEIVSADSMQIYKYMDIGTAKPSVEEMQGIKHHLIDIIYPDEEFSVALFKQYADNAIEQIYSKGKIPIVVGGTGLYINSLTYSLNFSESEPDKQYRDYLDNLAKQYGAKYLHDMLKNIDPDAANNIHPNNIKRVIRALEVFKNTGKRISEYQSTTKQNEPDYEFAYFCLDMPRNVLYDRINKRVDIMFEKGLIGEVEKLITLGYTRELQSMQAIGYKEVFDYLDGKLSLEEVKNIIKQNTRRYAKRQLTWFRKDNRIYWLEVFNKQLDEILSNMLGYIEGKLKLL
ncbi:tRNA (adenosine(37)-N6)-dimethylallyltransferase MiaA [Caloramator sp. mosi_1]|uniref:tRNA (adenosine(37)-N6)-dimethylallyltransferase MiaA n=1 Tax=Caloramator sp. mosi_1 TaxID=3023090 RepID=UPI00236174C8|nr:tRNA (adenosine(37)-N6)-dimethylallyltransferase MiaA [Caloramator sp. mosi_1]WDC83943.1 tRNA (adenosine(37)-N6)-dimethylallyltransferase MiaA [Caloramator sp. mosi_1]